MSNLGIVPSMLVYGMKSNTWNSRIAFPKNAIDKYAPIPIVNPNSARSGRRFPSFLNPKYIPSNETIPRINPNPT